MRRLFTAFICLLGATHTAWADQLPDVASAQLRSFVSSRDRGDLLDLVGTDLVSAYILDREIESRRGRIDVNDIRQDLQGGSLSARTGGTSVIARPGVTDLVSAALESGAFSRKSDDKSVTFSVNALPVAQLLSLEVPRGCGSLDADCRQGTGRWLRGLSGSVSFTQSTPTTALPAGTGATAEPVGFRIGGRTLQSVAIRYELFVRERDHALMQMALDEASSALQVKAEAFLKTQASFETKLGEVLKSSGWSQGTIDLLERNVDSLERLEAVLLERYRAVYDVVRGSAELQALHAATLPDSLAYISAQNALLAEKLYRKALTLDYLHERPTDQPTLHQARLVFATPLGRKTSAIIPGAAPAQAAPTGMLTVNGGVSWFEPGTPEGSAWKVRDGQFSMGLDWSPRTSGRFRPTYTAAYYFQYMVSNGVLKFTGDAVTPGGAAIPLAKAAKELLNTKGPIHITQFRVNLPVGNGVSLPAAISYSNRSELIEGRAFWQGHFGVSYDFSQLRRLAAAQ